MRPQKHENVPQNGGDMPQKSEKCAPNSRRCPPRPPRCDSRYFFGLGLGDFRIHSFLRRDRWGLAPAPTTPTRIGAFSTQKDKTLGCPPAAANPPHSGQACPAPKTLVLAPKQSQVSPGNGGPKRSGIDPKNSHYYLDSVRDRFYPPK